MTLSRCGLAGFAAALALSGCATEPKQLYRWGGYDDALYTHYKHPQDRTEFVEKMKKVVLESEQAGKKVPPGCYAEYGFALLEEGQNEAAESYFDKERDAWPESSGLMDKMVRYARRARPDASSQTATGDAGAAEGK
jgi:hypothetical protein